MRKILASMVILATFAVMPANAQFKFGVKGGMNNTEMKFSYDNLINNKNGCGWFAGPTVKFSFPLGIFSIGADGAVLYDERHSKAEYNGVEESIKLKSILIPINARMNISFLKFLGAYVATGPQFGFNVGNSGLDLTSSSSIKDYFQFKKSQFSWNVGVGLMFLNHLEVGMAYNFGIGKTGEVKDLTVDAVRDTPKQRSWVLSAAYYF